MHARKILLVRKKLLLLKLLELRRKKEKILGTKSISRTARKGRISPIGKGFEAS